MGCNAQGFWTWTEQKQPSHIWNFVPSHDLNIPTRHNKPRRLCAVFSDWTMETHGNADVHLDVSCSIEQNKMHIWTICYLTSWDQARIKKKGNNICKRTTFVKKFCMSLFQTKLKDTAATHETIMYTCNYINNKCNNMLNSTQSLKPLTLFPTVIKSKYAK